MFRLLTGVEVIAQILGIVFLVHGVDLILEQFADPVGGHLMEHPHAALTQQLPASVHGVEHEGEVMTAEGLFITETLKADNQMEWVQKMNALRSAVIETVNAEVIFV